MTEDKTIQETTQQDSLLRPKAGALSVTSHLEGSTSHTTKDSYIRTELLAHSLEKHIPSIQTFLLYLERKGKAANTVLAYRKNLVILAKKADLQNPIEVEKAIATYKKKNSRPATNHCKLKLCDCYARYCKYYKIEWEKPIYTPKPSSIQPPTREKALMLVSAAKGTLSMKIDIILQTGLRPIEIQGEKGLQAKDIHPDQNTITARITKGCNQRPALPITPELTARLQGYIRENNLKPYDLLFEGDARRLGEHYRRFRNRLAKKLNDQTIQTIRLYDLRHYYCTEKLRKTRSEEHTSELQSP
jgi:integrase